MQTYYSRLYLEELKKAYEFFQIFWTFLSFEKCVEQK